MARKDIWKKKRGPWHYAGYFVVLIIIFYISYSIYYYYSTAEQIEEFDECYERGCIKTFHMHVKLNFELCGENIKLPLEHGPLDGVHSHKRRNSIHFHEKLSYDNTTGKLINTTPLQLSEVMNEFDIRFNERCVQNYCKGDICEKGEPGTVRMFVNDKPSTEFDRYVWKDGDEILITFN